MLPFPGDAGSRSSEGVKQRLACCDATTAGLLLTTMGTDRLGGTDPGDLSGQVSQVLELRKHLLVEVRLFPL